MGLLQKYHTRYCRLFSQLKQKKTVTLTLSLSKTILSTQMLDIILDVLIILTKRWYSVT